MTARILRARQALRRARGPLDVYHARRELARAWADACAENGCRVTSEDVLASADALDEHERRIARLN